jgi:hypothetical protein
MSNELSAKQRSALQRVIDDPELQPWLFKKVDKTIWFDAFVDQGLFSPELNPKPIKTKKNTFHVPSWPITEYLVSSSTKIKEENDKKSASKYLTLLKDVTQYAIENNYSNHRTWWQFSKVLRNLPLDTISIDDIRCVRYWLEDNFDKYLVGKEVSEWIVVLVNNKDGHSRSLALWLLDALFTIGSVEDKYSTNRKEAILQLDSYQAEEFVNKSAIELGNQLGWAAVELFKKKFTEVLEINSNDKWSNVWRNAIAEHKQNSRNDDADDIVLKLFRDSLIGYFQSNQTAESNEKLIAIISSDFQTIKRIGIYVASECFENISKEVIDLVIDRNHFNDKYRHELWHFLNKHFTKLNEAQQTSVIESISGLMVTNDETGAIEDKPTAYKQSNWYAAIKEVSELANANYQKCIQITGVEPDHPDFSSYMSGGVVVNESPLTVTELAVMLEEPMKLLKFLNEYDHVGHFDEPGIEGLVETFGALVSLEDCTVLNNLKHFIDLKPHYLNKIFSSYSQLWSGKSHRALDNLWPKLIDFAHTLFKQDSFWQTPENNDSSPFIGDKNWVVSSYCRLVESGCEKDERAFDINLSDTVKSTLELLLERVNGRDFDNDSDAVSIAINSPRGRCLEAYLKLALYQCRNVKNDDDERQNIWAEYEPVFSNELNKPATANEYEFITLVVMYVLNFSYLSKKWTSENLDKMFGEVNSLQWLCAVQSYTYVGQLIPEIHKIFKANNFYVAILDNRNLKDTVKARYIEYMCIAHIHKIENLDDDDSVVQLLLKRKNDNELSKMIWFLWSIRNKDNDVTQKLIFDLWPKLVELIGKQTTEQRPLASKLALWAEYIKNLDEQSKLWLCEVAPFVQDDHNGMSFMKQLARMSDTAPIDTADIWKATLVNPFYMYDLKPLEQIFKNLIAIGKEGKDAASEIAGVYIKNRDEAVVMLYQGLDKD